MVEPSNGKPLGGYANYWFARNDFLKAIEFQEHDLALDDARLHGSRDCLTIPGRLHAGSSATSMASVLDPKDSESISGPDLCAHHRVSSGTRRRPVKRAIVLDPKNPLPLAYLAETKRGKKFSDAVSAYEQALALDPSVPTLHMGLGLVLARKGDLKGALERNAESDRSRSSEWSFPRKHSLRPHQHG